MDRWEAAVEALGEVQKDLQTITGILQQTRRTVQEIIEDPHVESPMVRIKQPGPAVPKTDVSPLEASNDRAMATAQRALGFFKALLGEQPGNPLEAKAWPVENFDPADTLTAIAETLHVVNEDVPPVAATAAAIQHVYETPYTGLGELE